MHVEKPEEVESGPQDGRFYALSPEALRQARRERLMTQRQLAGSSGVHRGTVSQLEWGGRRRVRAGTLQALAEALGVGPEELLRGSGEEDR